MTHGIHELIDNQQILGLVRRHKETMYRKESE